MLGINDMLIPRDGDNKIRERGGIEHRHDPETVHDGLEALERVNFGDNHIGTQPPRPIMRSAHGCIFLLLG